MPIYNNTVKSDDPKYQVRMFNGKPQFRIRKRQESAKVSGLISRDKTRKNNEISNNFNWIENSTNV